MAIFSFCLYLATCVFLPTVLWLWGVLTISQPFGKFVRVLCECLLLFYSKDIWITCKQSIYLYSLLWFCFNASLGYANAKIYKCDNLKCPRPACYISGGSSKDDSFPCLRPNCSGRFQLVRHVSFVDCPGHDILMATMLNGAAVMDAALLLIAGMKKSLILTICC